MRFISVPVMQFINIMFVRLLTSRLLPASMLPVPNAVYSAGAKYSRGGCTLRHREAVDDGYKIKRGTMMPSIFFPQIPSSSSFHMCSRVLCFSFLGHPMGSQVWNWHIIYPMRRSWALIQGREYIICARNLLNLTRALRDQIRRGSR